MLRGHKDKLFISALRELQTSSGNKYDSHELKRQTRQKIESGLKGGDSDTTCHMNSEKEGLTTQDNIHGKDKEYLKEQTVDERGPR